MELASGENVLVETSLRQVADVAAFIAKMMSEIVKQERKVEEVTNDNENPKTKVASHLFNLCFQVFIVVGHLFNFSLQGFNLGHHLCNECCQEVTSDNENLKKN